jgi:hypothetical protein
MTIRGSCGLPLLDLAPLAADNRGRRRRSWSVNRLRRWRRRSRMRGSTPREKRGWKGHGNYRRVTRQPAAGKVCGNIEHPFSSQLRRRSVFQSASDRKLTQEVSQRFPRNAKIHVAHHDLASSVDRRTEPSPGRPNEPVPSTVACIKSWFAGPDPEPRVPTTVLYRREIRLRRDPVTR